VYKSQLLIRGVSGSSARHEHCHDGCLAADPAAKNGLFSKSVEGAKVSATLYGLVMTCRGNCAQDKGVHMALTSIADYLVDYNALWMAGSEYIRAIILVGTQERSQFFMATTLSSKHYNCYNLYPICSA
jgi:hypothetical protein